MRPKIFDIKAETDVLLQQLHTRNTYSSSSSSTQSNHHEQAIVIDYGKYCHSIHASTLLITLLFCIGSYECKAGWSGNTDPQSRVRLVI
jgi:hypothetical protein